MAGWGQKSLVVLQAALSLVLLCAAGLLARSLSNMQHQNFGFDTTNRYILHIDPADGRLQAEPAGSALSATARQPGGDPRSEAGELFACTARWKEITGARVCSSKANRRRQPGTHDHGASWLRASPHYFDTIGTKIVEGRAMNEQDTPDTRNVAVVNRFFEQKVLQGWPRDRQAFQRRCEASGIFRNRRCDRRHPLLGTVGEDAADVLSGAGAECAQQRCALPAV